MKGKNKHLRYGSCRKMDLYTSSNGWIAWVTPDPVTTHSVSPSNNKFVIVGFLPSNQFCISPNSYGSVEQAQEIIASFDQQTIAFECRDSLIKVFTCFDGSYWWQRSCINGGKYPPERIYTACNATEAIELVGSQLSCSVAQSGSSRRSNRTYLYPQYLSA